MPQLSAIMEASKASLKGISLIADGGIRHTGDMVKHSCRRRRVMMGSVFAGTEESPGETIILKAVSLRLIAAWAL